MPNFVPHLTLLALAASLLTACAGVNSNPVTTCPPIKEYSREFQRKLADEMESAPENTSWPNIVYDYHALRLLLKECH